MYVHLEPDDTKMMCGEIGLRRREEHWRGVDLGLKCLWSFPFQIVTNKTDQIYEWLANKTAEQEKLAASDTPAFSADEIYRRLDPLQELYKRLASKSCLSVHVRNRGNEKERSFR